MSELRILQIVPAPPGLFAQYKQSDGTIEKERVWLLALVHEQTNRDCLSYVAPMCMEDFDFGLCQENSNFYGIVHEPEEVAP